MLRGMLLLLNFTRVPRLVYRLMLDPRVPLRHKLILPAAIIYLISPLDLVPDILPALGRIDDVLVLLLALAAFLVVAPKNVVLEHIRDRGAPGPNREDGRPRPKVVEGSYRFKDDEETSHR